LLSLHRNGINKNDGRIIGATGAHPLILCSQGDIESFRRQTMIYDLIGIREMDIINAHLQFFCE
jgi:tetrahydromethanopterin S-methyltransferase subunit A